MKISALAFVLGILLACGPLQGQAPDTLTQESILINDEVVVKKWHKTPTAKALKPAIYLVGAGLFLTGRNKFFLNKYEIRDDRNRVLPEFSTDVDDYLQFAPIPAVYGLELLGAEPKNNLANRTVLIIKSELLMMAMVYPLKNLSKVLRPDDSNHHAFPSGHTAQAFTAATFIHKEYGHLSPWYSIVAYTTASSVAVFRVLNNKHWVSDVIAGAGVGILATNLAYLTHQFKWGKQKKLSLMPAYSGGNFMLAARIQL